MSAFYVLCCRPDYFAVVDQDNAFQEDGMRLWLEKPDYWKKRILATWDKAAAELVKRGAVLMQIPAHPDLPDQCFAADVAVAAMKAYGPKYVLKSNMNSPVRQREVPLALKELQKYGFTSVLNLQTENDNKNEGTGDFLHLPGHNMFVQGYGPRSQRGFSVRLTSIVNQLVAEVPLIVADNHGQGDLASSHTKGFHLDTLVFPLPDKRIIGYFDGMHPSTRAFFERLYPKTRRIELTAAEADMFITNGLAVPDKNFDQGHILFMSDTTPEHIRGRLEDWGFGFEGFDFEPGRLAGGGLHCMFNFVLPTNYLGSPRAVNQLGWPENMELLPPDIRKDITCESLAYIYERRFECVA